MENLIIIILTITTILFVTLNFFSRKEINNITNQLGRVNKTDTNSKILLSSSNRYIENLALEINKTLEQKQKTEIEYKRIDLELRQAIVNMSHDLRTPLTSIMGYVQLLEDDKLSSDERNEYMNVVKSRTKSLQVQISSFYDLSRLEAREYKFELESLNLSNILSEMLVSFYHDFESKGIEPMMEIDEKCSSIIADENSVRRIFSNLIQNSLRYGNDFVSISLNQNDNYIITKFINDAPDLSEGDVNQLFERFFTGNRARSEQSTGLGLALTKELVEQMGHTIYAEGLDGKLSIIIEWRY